MVRGMLRSGFGVFQGRTSFRSDWTAESFQSENMRKTPTNSGASVVMFEVLAAHSRRWASMTTVDVDRGRNNEVVVWCSCCDSFLVGEQSTASNEVLVGASTSCNFILETTRGGGNVVVADGQ